MADLERGTLRNEELLVFDRYDEEFKEMTDQIQKSLDEEPPSPYTRNLLQQCNDLLKQMALEARTLKQPALIQRVKDYKSKHYQLVQQFERDSLLAGQSSNVGASRSHQERMKQTEDMLSNQNETLERSLRSIQETEQIAMEITEELSNNRETLMSAHGRVKDVSSLTGRARRLLNTMTARAIQQKMVLYAVGGGLVVAFVLIIWMMRG
ncbi:hypothetical protein ACA910_012989 [Epithemia clementina (nom. ined.)]